jgi:hypothetical protein
MGGGVFECRVYVDVDGPCGFGFGSRVFVDVDGPDNESSTSGSLLLKFIIY